MESVADSFKRQYYCSYLDAYVTNKDSCEIMSKLSGKSEKEGAGKMSLACKKGKVITTCVALFDTAFRIMIEFFL